MPESGQEHSQEASKWTDDSKKIAESTAQVSLLPVQAKRERRLPHHLLGGLFDRKEELDAHLDEIRSTLSSAR